MGRRIIPEVTDGRVVRPAAVFGPIADSYAASRPGYPSELFDAIWHRLASVSPLAADVAAGSGIATEALVSRGARTLAIEPARQMAAHASVRLARRAGWLGAVQARAEALPLAPGRLDLVTVAQAFHWLDPVAALAEFATALRSGGVLAVFWNVTEEDDFSRAVVGLIERYNPICKRPVTVAMRSTPLALNRNRAFATERPLEFAHTRRLSLDQYLTYARSWSYVGGSLSASDLASFERELRTMFAEHNAGGAREEHLSAVLHLARRT
ncbi:MAG: class I SAM-dependent methyltransferase [Gemmatimonadota bacterium]